MIGAEHVYACIYQLFPKIGSFIFGYFLVNPNTHYLVVILKPPNVEMTGAGWLAVYAFAPTLSL